MKGITADNYRSRNLKVRFQNEYQNSIFHQPASQNQFELAYSSDISLQDVINSTATSFVRARDDVSEETGGQHIPPNSIQTLYHAAQIIKVDIASCEGINITPLDNDDLTLHKSKEIIPQSLYWIVRWIVTTAEHEVEAFGNHNSSCKNEADERHIEDKRCQSI